MKRRDFIKSVAAALAGLAAVPVHAFVPPRRPFVRMNRGRGLEDLVEQLGVCRYPPGLGMCEGKILDMEDWDGTGYPCLVENRCTYGPNPPREWIYDFDLWNFRDDDYIDDLNEGIHRWQLLEQHNFQNTAAFYAWRRFGPNVHQVVQQGGGWLKLPSVLPSEIVRVQFPCIEGIRKFL